MSTASEISRLRDARDIIRNKLVNFGVADSTDLIDTLASKLDAISNNGAVSATVQEGASYTIPAGYHNGSGTVSGVAGGGSYTLQTKTITPTTSQQNVTPDSGYYGLSGVTVNAIPSNYKDVSSVTATDSDVLANKVIVNSTGTVTGSMHNIGAVNQTLTTTTSTYTVPSGYHNGLGTVSIVLEEKTATPSASSQNITPTSGKVLSKVTINAIPSNYADVTDDDAIAGDILYGKVAHSVSGGAAVAITGSMTNNGAISATIDGLTTTSYTVGAGYHNGSGTVSLTSDIEIALASI